MNTLNYAILVLMSMFVFACSEPKQPVDTPPEEIAEEEAPEEAAPLTGRELGKTIVSAEDSAWINQQIGELVGIEKFATRDNFAFFASLSAYKGDSSTAKKIWKILDEGANIYYPKFSIYVLDTRAGYIRFDAQAETEYVMTYWNLSDGGQLIANESWGCGPVCSSDLGFNIYDQGTYTLTAVEEIIPEVGQLAETLVPGVSESVDPLEFRYILPQNGKNINFCLEDKCLELKWDDGKFLR